ncbi:hypothetical protein, partial [Hyalangium sp.]|uniref:hypothetical protein n=1 Tax=Hyalangium sp. TaxID=2028555 RepID=UPI002D33E50C
AVIETYGELIYRRMSKTIDDPARLARTYALLLPGWLARSFNAMAQENDWAQVDMPTYDAALGLDAFGRPAAAAAAVGSNS